MKCTEDTTGRRCISLSLENFDTVRQKICPKRNYEILKFEKRSNKDPRQEEPKRIDTNLNLRKWLALFGQGPVNRPI